MGLLQPEAGLLFWMVIAFAIVLFILVKFGFPIIIRSVNSRKQFIDSSLEAAHQANQRLSMVEQSSKEMIAAAESKRTEILREATDMSKKVMAEAQRNAANEEKRLIQEARLRAENERQEILNGARSEVASISIAIAEKLLRGKLSQDGEQDILAGKIFDEIQEKKKD